MVKPLPALAAAPSVTAVPVIFAPATGSVIATTGGVLLTLMLTGAAVVLLPDESVATAVSAWTPLASGDVFSACV